MNASEVEQTRKDIQAMEDAIFKPATPPPTPPVTPPAESPAVPLVPSIEPPTPPVTPPTESPAPPVEPPAPTPPVEPLPVETPPAPPVPPTPPIPEDFKHKYDVLKGKYNKETKDLRTALEQASTRADSSERERIRLDGQVRDLTARLERLEKGEKPPVVTDTSDYDPEKDPDTVYLKREFPDAFKSFQSLMDRKVAAAVSRVRQELQQVNKNVETFAEQGKLSARTSFNQYLDNNVKGWKTIDVDPGFATWLDQPAPYTNIPKRALIDKAIRDFDGPTAAKFFIDYALENSADDTPAPTPSPSTPKPTAPVSVAPPRAITPPVPPRPQNTEIVTTQEIDQFYQDRIAGKYRGGEAEMLTQEKRIEKAVAEGRVR